MVARRNLLIVKPFLLYPNTPGRATKPTHIRDEHTANSLYNVASEVHAELLVRGQEGDLREWGGILNQKGRYVRCVYNNGLAASRDPFAKTHCNQNCDSCESFNTAACCSISHWPHQRYGICL